MLASFDESWGSTMLAILAVIVGFFLATAVLGLWASRSVVGAILAPIVAWMAGGLVVRSVPGNEGLLLSFLIGPTIGVAIAWLLRLGRWRLRPGGLDHDSRRQLGAPS